ncbi:hypothetical protein ACFQX6_62965 [Streptosporangium lutulentum]
MNSEEPCPFRRCSMGTNRWAAFSRQGSDRRNQMVATDWAKMT